MIRYLGLGRNTGLCHSCASPLVNRHTNTRFCYSCKRGRGQSFALSAVGKAIARGRLPAAADCICVDCGKQASCYDHRDYRKPLEVDPVCQTCNRRRGLAMPVNNGNSMSEKQAAQCGMDIRDLIRHYRFLSVAAKRLRVSRQTLYNWGEHGIPYSAQIQIELDTGGVLKADQRASV